jgi:hypothetical protein
MHSFLQSRNYTFLQETKTNAQQYSVKLQALWGGREKKMGENEGNAILFVLP